MISRDEVAKVLAEHEPPRTCQSVCCGNVLYGTECYDNAGYCDACIRKYQGVRR